MKRKKSTNWKQKAKKEKILIIILTIAIITLTLVLGYSIYDAFKTKAETTTKIGSLNESIESLTQ